MIFWTISLLIVLMFSVILVKNVEIDKNIIEVTPEEAVTFLNSDEHLFVDVREEDEHQSGHIEATINMPLSKLSKSYKNLPHDKYIVLVCRSGHRSFKALSYLKDQGFDKVMNLSGGVIAWQKAGYKLN